MSGSTLVRQSFGYCGGGLLAGDRGAAFVACVRSGAGSEKHAASETARIISLWSGAVSCEPIPVARFRLRRLSRI